MTGTVQNLLTELRSGLEKLYGDRLRGLYLYGSYARREQQWDSDVDVLIVLDRIDSYGAEIDASGEIVARTSVDYGVSVSVVFVSEAVWRASEPPFSPTCEKRPLRLECAERTATRKGCARDSCGEDATAQALLDQR